MGDGSSFVRLESMLRPVTRTKPRIAEAARTLLGPSANLMQTVGLPARVADWFVADDGITVCNAVEHARYTANGDVIEITNSIRIGRSEFGVFVIVCGTGHLLYVDEDGTTQLINTSLERFLYFVGRFNQSADVGYVDVAQIRCELQVVDPIPLRNPDGIWSLTIEETEAGLY